MNRNNLFLSVPLAGEFLRLVVSFAENASLIFGLTAKQSLAVALAAEEVFMHAVNFSPQADLMEVRAEKGSYFAKFEFIFPAGALAPRAFNITATVSPDDPESLDRMGLLLASRLVDLYEFEPESGGRMKLTLLKEKIYSQADVSCKPVGRPLDEWSVRRPEDQAETCILLDQINGFFSENELPEFMRFPGKVADMILGGECRAALAIAPSGSMGGGLVWRMRGPRAMEFFGPYLLEQPANSTMGEELMDFCLNDLARSTCLSLIGRFNPPGQCSGYFQKLGAVEMLDREETWKPKEAVFRLMDEDPGELVWCHPDLIDFLESEYERLHLPREVRTIKNSDASRSGFSVISSRLNVPRKVANLKPAFSGRDIEKNLASHLSLFKNEGLKMVFFEIDLGAPWQSEYVPALLTQGFTPRIILPCAGKKDILVFQLGKDQA